jgi:hypothetical protein
MFLISSSIATDDGFYNAYYDQGSAQWYAEEYECCISASKFTSRH